jgi:hypothetical protein
MTLIELFYAPGKIFSELKQNSWAVPLGASMILFVLSGIVTVNAVGAGALQYKVSHAYPGAFDSYTRGGDFGKLMMSALAFGAILSAIEVVIGALAIWWVVRLSVGVTNYSLVLAVCSYGAYSAELMRLLVRLGVVLYHHLVSLPLTSESRFQPDATLFLDKAIVAGPLHSLAASLDLVTFGFILVAAFGLSKSIPKLRFSKATLVVVIPWIAWTLAKCVMELRRPTG